VKTWPTPSIPAIPGRGEPLRLYDSSSGQVRPVSVDGTIRMYVCGITPYDATHLGHAATYVTFDVLRRAVRDAGQEVRYVQNVTDVDDPLLERAARDGRDWRELATAEIDLFREDMTALAVIPPEELVGVVEAMPEIVDVVRRLVRSGATYHLPVPDGPGADIYLDLARSPTFGAVSGWSREQMAEVFADRGGDPERPGKRHPFDPLLWRAARPGEPSWGDDLLGAGRPGWHVECTAISLARLGHPLDVSGGGTDLVFPHHEMTAVQALALADDGAAEGAGTRAGESTGTGAGTATEEFARHHVHQAMVGLDGAKMSKSRGNLVLVSTLRRDGIDSAAIRLLLLAQHYRHAWEYRPALLEAATNRLARWRRAMSGQGGADAGPTMAGIRRAVADDLDTRAALAAVDAWCDVTLAGDHDDAGTPGLLARTVDAVLGIRL
jgi:L-cysteine:1D-myo-inositol 2-amino-2-deoxy-alpha-D-glucopyranoside ligase